MVTLEMRSGGADLKFAILDFRVYLQVGSVKKCRVMYFWYNKFKHGPQYGMGGFTRILHSGKPDQFMDEIPTFVAQPLLDGMDQVDEDGEEGS
ncbi:Hydroxyproline O-arabinosyltransferase [Vigna angularis]|uniref:Hydroxyproline O-arabinosyltransferase n=1 Tax=Phaseolus angularis TaxID=3914 RepID=A0A8T0KZ66_PHAAN|nr:Hydroxyproline O-arabinosyltransferase [Vigna angularis]